MAILNKYFKTLNKIDKTLKLIEVVFPSKRQYSLLDAMIESQKKSLQVLHGGRFKSPKLFENMKYDDQALSSRTVNSERSPRSERPVSGFRLISKQ